MLNGIPKLMKNMPILLQAAAILILGNVVQSASLKRGRDSASISSTKAHAAAQLREREIFEVRSHAQLSRWCNATLKAQGSRQNSLQHLLLQAQQASQAHAGPEASDAVALVHLETEAASLGSELERQRLQQQALRSVKQNEATSNQLDLVDAKRDVDALQRTSAHLTGSANPGSQSITLLLEQAKRSEQQAQQKVLLIQTQSSTASAGNLSKLEEQYRSNKANIFSFQHRFFTTQRSLDVLTSALEDESAYLSSLQSVCGAESRVHERIESHVLPVLRSPPKLAMTESSVPATRSIPKAVPAVSTQAVASTPKASISEPSAPLQAAPKPAVQKTVPKPAAPKPAAPKPVAQEAPKAELEAAPQPKAAAAPKAPPKAKSSKTVSVAKAPAPSKVATKVVKKLHVAPAKHAAPTTSAPATKDPFADDDDDTFSPPPAPAPKHAAKAVTAAAAPKKVKVVPLKSHKAKSSKKVTVAKAPAPSKKATKVAKKIHAAKKLTTTTAAPAMKDPFADDDDDSSSPPPAPAPKHAAKASAKPLPAKPHPAPKHAAKAKAAPPPSPPKMKDPFADDDDDAIAPSPPPPPKPKPKAKAKAHVAPPAPKKQAPKDPFADDDDDAMPPAPPPPVAHAKKKKPAPPPPKKSEVDDFADDDMAPPSPPPPAVHVNKQKAKPAAKSPKKNEFMDGVYDSAAGNMPAAYSAWKPAGASASASPAPPPHASAEAKKEMMAMLGTGSSDQKDDDLDFGSAAIASPSPPPPAKAAAIATAAPAAEPDLSPPAKAAEAAGAKAAEAAFDADDDALSNPKPAPKKAKAVPPPAADTAFDSMDTPSPAPPKAKASENAFDSADDTFSAPKPSHKAKPPPSDDSFSMDSPAPPPPPPAKKPPPPPADDFLSDDTPAVETPKPHGKKNAASKKPKTNFMDGVYDAAAGKLPGQYSAWTPGGAGDSAESSKKAALAQMEADFDSDDDEAPTPAPKRKKHHHRAPAPAPPPPPARRRPPASDDGVVYDDDDLPKHHTSMMGLEGGWQALMKKPKAVEKKPAMDKDVAIMQSLYTKDGGLPSQYTAWSPDTPKAAPPSPPPARGGGSDGGDGGDGGDTMDLVAAAKQFAKNPEAAFDFLQVNAEPSDRFDELVSQAAIKSPEAPFRFRGALSFLETSAVTADTSRMAAASALLEQYADVLKSNNLQKLVKAKLPPSSLETLYNQLRNVDPLNAKRSITTQGKQAQAEHMCTYFQEHADAAAPVQQAVSFMETASNELAESVSRRASILEEISARKQLQKTMEQDLSSLSILAGVAKQGADASALAGLEKQLTGDAAAAVGVSAEAHAELKDLLDLAIQKRTAALQEQRKKLTALQGESKAADADLAQKKAHATTSQAAIEAARRKLSIIAKSCDATMDALSKKRHAGHMEAHAIGMALKVLAGH